VPGKASISCGPVHLSGTTLDVRIGGVFVQTSRTLPIGSIARVSIDIKPEPALTDSARVLLVAGEDCMGMQFENLGVKEAKRLQNFLLPVLPKVE